MPPLDARAHKSRKALLNASISLLVSNPSASLTEVAAHAGVGRATLYRHFETREQLIQEIAYESLEMTEAVLAPIKEENLQGRAALEALFKLILPLADRYHFLLSLWNIAANDPKVLKLYEDQLAILGEMVEQGKEQGEISHAFSTTWVVTLVDSLIYSCWWLLSQEYMDLEQAADHAIQTLFNGIKA